MEAVKSSVPSMFTVWFSASASASAFTTIADTSALRTAAQPVTVIWVAFAAMVAASAAEIDTVKVWLGVAPVTPHDTAALAGTAATTR